MRERGRKMPIVSLQKKEEDRCGNCKNGIAQKRRRRRRK
jgi:hypothetical protein